MEKEMKMRLRARQLEKGRKKEKIKGAENAGALLLPPTTHPKSKRHRFHDSP